MTAVWPKNQPGFLVVQEGSKPQQAYPVVLNPERDALLRAQIEQEHQAYRQRLLDLDTVLTHAHPLLQPIVALHSRDEYGSCTGCDCGAYSEEAPDWPCSTIDLIVADLGPALVEAIHKRKHQGD